MFPSFHGMVNQNNFGGLRLWLSAQDLETLWQNTTKTTQADSDEEIVKAWDDKSGRENHFSNGSGAATLQAVNNGGKSFWAVRGNGAATGTLAHPTKATWKFLHNGSGFTVTAVVRVNGTNPNALYGIVGNNGGSSVNIGLWLSYDDRSAVPRDDTIVATIYKGVAGQPIINAISSNDKFLSNEFRIIAARFDPDAASEQFKFYVDGTEAVAASVANLPYSTADPTYTIQLFAIGNNAAPAWIDIAELKIYDVAVSLTELANLWSDWTTNYGIGSDTIPFPTAYADIVTSPTDYDAFGIGLVAANGDALYIGRRGTTHLIEDAKLIKFVNSGAGWGGAIDIIDNAGYDDRDAGGGVVPATGTILIFYTRTNSTTSADLDIRCLRSTDNGGTFTDIGTAIDVGLNTAFRAYGNLIELPSGKLLKPCYGDGASLTFRAFTIESTDDGLTWGNYTNIVEAAAPPRPTEASICYLSGATDGTSVLLSVIRDDVGKLMQYSSSNGGATWTSDGVLPNSRGVGLDTSPWLHRVGSTIYLVFADRNTPGPGIKWSEADIDAVVGNPAAWSDPRSVYDSNGNSHMGSPSIVEYDGNLHLFFHDGTAAIDPDVMTSII